jgi:hypothetical protein
LRHEGFVTPTCRCQLCRTPLDLAQTFRFLVETDAAADPKRSWACARELPSANGKPLRVCRRCQADVRARPRRPMPLGLLAVGGVLSVGWLLTTLLAGPRA